MHERVTKVVYDVLAQLNGELFGGEEKLAASLDTVLFGAGAALDSMGLVNLIVMTEQRVEEEFGAVVSLADERAMSQQHSPFRDVRTFIGHIERVLQDAKGG